MDIFRKFTLSLQKTVSNLRAILPRRDLERNLPDFTGLNRVLPSVMPAQAGIRAPGSRRDQGGESPPPGDARSREPMVTASP